jgi:hypothetical protein
MGNSSSFNCLYTDIGAIIFKPIVANTSKTFSTFAAEAILSWKLQIGPAIGCHDHIAFNTPGLKVMLGRKQT